jgi:hypothetical protein
LRLNFWGRFQRLFDAYQWTCNASTQVNLLASKSAKQFHINILCVSAKYADEGAGHSGRNCTFILRLFGIQLVSRSSKMKWKESKSSEAGNWFVALHWGKVGRISFSTYPMARRVRSQAIKAVAWAAERLSVPQTRRWWIPANTEASPTIEATSVVSRKYWVAELPTKHTHTHTHTEKVCKTPLFGLQEMPKRFLVMFSTFRY